MIIFFHHFAECFAREYIGFGWIFDMIKTVRYGQLNKNRQARQTGLALSTFAAFLVLTAFGIGSLASALASNLLLTGALTALTSGACLPYNESRGPTVKSACTAPNILFAITALATGFTVFLGFQYHDVRGSMIGSSANLLAEAVAVYAITIVGRHHHTELRNDPWKSA